MLFVPVLLSCVSLHIKTVHGLSHAVHLAKRRQQLCFGDSATQAESRVVLFWVWISCSILHSYIPIAGYIQAYRHSPPIQQDERPERLLNYTRCVVPGHLELKPCAQDRDSFIV